jgi:uncharacterized phiE125 gp8 family phage protein
MNPILIDGPAVEPVSLAEMKLYLRVDDDVEDELIAGLVKAARLMVEAAARRILVEQTWVVALDAWPRSGAVMLPLSPLIAVDGITARPSDATEAPVDPAHFEVDAAGDPPGIVLRGPLPEGSIRIACRAGYGASPEDVPQSLRLAMKAIVAHWYTHRGDMEGLQQLPPDVLTLVSPFQRARL